MKFFNLGLLTSMFISVYANNNYTSNLRAMPTQYPTETPTQYPTTNLPINRKNNSIDYFFINYDIIYETQDDKTTPCCLVCLPDKSMYYSIDTTTDMCGQTCINDNMYILYKLFEPGLTKADQNLICPKKGYEIYDSTVTHGFLFLKDTLDLYKPFNYYNF